MCACLRVRIRIFIHACLCVCLHRCVPAGVSHAILQVYRYYPISSHLKSLTRWRRGLDRCFIRIKSLAEVRRTTEL